MPNTRGCGSRTGQPCEASVHAQWPLEAILHLAPPGGSK